MGVPVRDASNYEKSLYEFGHFAQRRSFSPHLHSDLIYKLLGYARQGLRLVRPMHNFSKDLIAKRRVILDSQGWKNSNDDGSTEEDSSNV